VRKPGGGTAVADRRPPANFVDRQKILVAICRRFGKTGTAKPTYCPDPVAIGLRESLKLASKQGIIASQVETVLYKPLRIAIDEP
jgi:hypothetical protein